MSKTYQLKREITLPIGLEEAWDFFSEPRNLRLITPAEMDFKILFGAETQMYEGQMIGYTVKPVLSIPVFWLTEITHIKQHGYFVDEQRRGPYSLWHHEHIFDKIDEGNTHMKDIVTYALPLGFLGDIMHMLFVKRQLEKIFNFRTEFLKKHFSI